MPEVHDKCTDCGRRGELECSSENGRPTCYWIQCSHCCNSGEAGTSEEEAWALWDSKDSKVFSVDYITVWADGSITIADDMGFIGRLGRGEVKRLWEALVEHFGEGKYGSRR